MATCKLINVVGCEWKCIRQCFLWIYQSSRCSTRKRILWLKDTLICVLKEMSVALKLHKGLTWRALIRLNTTCAYIHVSRTFMFGKASATLGCWLYENLKFETKLDNHFLHPIVNIALSLLFTQENRIFPQNTIFASFFTLKHWAALSLRFTLQFQFLALFLAKPFDFFANIFYKRSARTHFLRRNRVNKTYNFSKITTIKYVRPVLLSLTLVIRECNSLQIVFFLFNFRLKKP